MSREIAERTVLGSPVQRLGIDKVGSCKSGKPGTCEANSRCDSKSVGTETLRWDFSAGEPSVGGDHAVVAYDVHD